MIAKLTRGGVVDSSFSLLPGLCYQLLQRLDTPGRLPIAIDELSAQSAGVEDAIRLCEYHEFIERFRVRNYSQLKAGEHGVIFRDDFAEDGVFCLRITQSGCACLAKWRLATASPTAETGTDDEKGGAVNHQAISQEPMNEAERSAITRDVFLSHATIDKEKFVRPFANELAKRKISYWLDEAEIHWGNSISRKINEGLKNSNFVVVFLSDAFIGRNWTESELAAALSRENAEGRSVVLPIIIGTAARLLAEYPLLRDKAYLGWDIGVKAIADELQRLTNRQWSKSELDQYIAEKADLNAFEASAIWGDGYRLLGTILSGDEGSWYFWNERKRTVEKNWRDSVRWHGIQPMTQNDIEFVRAVVIGRPATHG